MPGLFLTAITMAGSEVGGMHRTGR